MTQKAECRECGKPCALRKDGTVRLHSPAGSNIRTCHGSNRPPHGAEEDLECPKCGKRIRVSEVDPDATLSEMVGHLRSFHLVDSRDETSRLLARSRALPAAA